MRGKQLRNSALHSAALLLCFHQFGWESITRLGAALLAKLGLRSMASFWTK